MLKLFNPRQTVLLTTRDKIEIMGRETEKDNVMTIDWHMPASFDPFFYSISVSNSSFTKRIIEQSGIFCVNFIPYHMKKAAVFCGRNTGQHIDKITKLGLAVEECEKIDCFRLSESVAYLECEVVDSKEVGDHTVFFARVLDSKLNAVENRLFHVFGDEFTTTR